MMSLPLPTRFWRRVVPKADLGPLRSFECLDKPGCASRLSQMFYSFRAEECPASGFDLVIILVFPRPSKYCKIT